MRRIKTPEIDEQTMIIPDIFVIHDDGKREIIDAKRSGEAVQYKDLELYPKYADHVSFWCLFGDNQSIMKDSDKINSPSLAPVATAVRQAAAFFRPTNISLPVSGVPIVSFLNQSARSALLIFSFVLLLLHGSEFRFLSPKPV